MSQDDPAAPGRELHLGINVLADGAFPCAWRASETDPSASLTLAHWTHIAEVAEHACMDAIFLSDTGALRDPEGGPWEIFDPSIVLTTLASRTERIGLVPTIPTQYEEPYNVARRLATLDHLSNGRAGWNVVTGANPFAAANFGAAPHPDKRDRYARALEFVDVACKLWDAWQADAVIGDKEGGVWADSARIHAIDHHGEYFDVAGPLSMPRSPQGRPVLLQAGGSADGLELAARYAEAIFAARAELNGAIAFRTEMRRRAAAFGRDPNHLLILPGLVFTLGGTEAEALARREHLEEIAGFRLVATVAGFMGLDARALDLDAPLPRAVLDADPETAGALGSKGFRDMLVELAREEQLTLRQLTRRAMIHRNVIGAPEQVADAIEDWFRAGAVDGFNLMPDVAPSGLDAFAEHVIPLLQRRGIFRTEYAGTTLRSHLGISSADGRQARSGRAAPPAEPAGVRDGGDPEQIDQLTPADRASRVA